jgi:hypothetical protein
MPSKQSLLKLHHTFQCFPTFLCKGETPKIIFHIPRNYENFDRPEKVDREEPFSCHRWGGSLTIHNYHRHRTNNTMLNTKWPKQSNNERGSWKCTKITSALSTVGQKSLRHFAGIICFISVHCRNIYTYVVNQQTHTGKIYFILLTTYMFRSLLRPSSGCFTRILITSSSDTS